MKLSIYQVDAFTSKLFGGNPAAVVPLNNWLSAETMQAIAAENNVSETAFFVPVENHFEIRWFTPSLEIDLCGHATLATAHILVTELGYTAKQINFNTQKSGSLEVSVENETYTLNFPARPPVAVEKNSELLTALGIANAIEVLRSRDFMVVLANEEAVRSVKPDFNALAELDCGVIVTAKGDEVDFVSRFFIPSAGINEDPVTGSAHCNLIPYWAEKLGKRKLMASQISDRRGDLACELVADRVLMSGSAITFLKGEIFI